ncbi:MAG TPA: hypothetical protein VHM28_05035, partial [Anaerolineales bacterium]|nr:hypothetical protein [Anaerolineales bacterium]
MLRRLGIFERALLISDQYAPFNVVIALQLEPPPVPAIMREALAALQKRHPLLMARIVTDAKGRASFESLS